MTTRNLVYYTLALLSCLLFFAFSGARAQQPTVPEKLQHIRQLIAILGGVDGLKRSMQDEITTLREKYPNLKKEYWESLTQNIHQKELPALIDRLVATYDTLLTEEEVAEMLRFYESPAGKKVAAAVPQISKESSNLFLQWRQGLVKKVADMQGGLIRAASSGDMNKVKELLVTGADVNERNAHGVTPLMAAAYKGNADLARLLIDKKADVNERSNKGSTPLMAAVESGNKTLVELLLSKGADPNLRDVRGLNAYQMALLRGQHDLMLFLRDKTKDTQPVEIRAVVAYLGRGQDCLPVSNEASLKHTYGRRLRAAGVSFEDRQSLLGHKSGKITTHYSAPELLSLIAASERVSARDAHKVPILVMLRKKKSLRVLANSKG